MLLLIRLLMTLNPNEALCVSCSLSQLPHAAASCTA